MGLSESQVYEKVKEALVEALGVEEDEVSPDAKLFRDLGAESIDVLDIVFRLERTFGIQVPKGELVPEGWLADPEYGDGTNITPKGLAEMKRRMPFADLSELEKDPKMSNIPHMFTVKTLVSYVQMKLAEKEKAA
jgi:acyl carrier protein